jgi:hypothetical protein
MRAGRYWMRLSRFLMIAASWRGVPQEPRLPRLFFMFDQAPSAGLRSGAYAGIWTMVSQSRCGRSKVRIWALMCVFRLSQHKMTGACSCWCAAVTSGVRQTFWQGFGADP